MIEHPLLEKRFVKPVADLIAIPPVTIALISAALLAIVTFELLPTAPLILPGVIFCVWLLANYFFEVVEHRGMGYSGWPVPSLETISTARRQRGVVFGILVASAVVLAALLASTSWWPVAQIFSFAALGLMPASAAALAMTGRPLQCINLRVLITVVGRMGPRYLQTLLGLVIFLLLARWALVRGGFAAFFVAGYSYMLLAYQLGGIVYARRSALGIDAPRSPEAQAERAHQELLARRQAELTHAYGFATRGNIEGALTHIEEAAAAEDEPVAARLWMFHRMCRWDDARPALQFGHTLQEILDELGHEADAKKVSVACEHLRHARSEGDRLGL